MPLLSASRSANMVDPATLLDAGALEYICSLISSGALVSCYCTRDRGAFGVSVTFEGEQEKEYFRATEELCDWLREVDKAVTALEPSAPSVKRPRKRG